MWAVNLSSARRQTGTFNAQPGVGTTWRFPGKKKKKSVTYAKDNDKDLPEPFSLDEIPEHLQFSIVAKMKFKDFAEFNVTSKFASEICDILADGVYFEIPTSHMEISELGSSFIEKTSPPMKILMIPPDETLRRIHFACDHLCIRENSLLVYRQHRVTVDKLTLDLSFQDAKVARKILQVVKPKFAQICNANQEMLEMKELHKLSSLHISHSKITFNDVFLNFKMDSLITSGETIIDIPSLIKFIHQWINSTREIKKFQIYTKYFNFSPLIKGLFDNLVFAGTQKNNANGIFLCRHREHRDCLKVIYTTDIFRIMLIKVKTLTGKEIELDIDNTDRVSRLKEKVEEKEGIPPSQQRLIFGGKQMNDDKTCEEYKVTGGCVIHLVLALRGGN